MIKDYLLMYSLILGILTIMLGFFVLLKNKKNNLNRIFFLLMLSSSIWAFGYWQWMMSDTPGKAYFWIQVFTIGSTFIPIINFHWVLELLKIRRRILLYLAYALGFLFIFFTTTSLYSFELYMPNNLQIYWPLANKFYSLYILFVYAGLILYSIYLLMDRYKSVEGIKKEQIKYIIIGSFLGFGGGASNFFMWYKIPILPWGHFLAVFYPILFAYAMITYRLMDIKVVMRKYSVYILSIVSIAVPAFLVKNLLAAFFSRESLVIDLFIFLLAVILFPSIKSKYYRFATKYLFSSLYDEREVIAGISHKLKITLDINNIYSLISDSIVNNFHSKTLTVLLHDGINKKYDVDYGLGQDITGAKSFVEDKDFMEMIIKEKVVLVNELEGVLYVRYKNMVDILKKYNIEVIVSLSVNNELIGGIALGPKESGEMYNDEDIRTLKIIGAQSALAIQNALLFKDTMNFGSKLKKKIKEATDELRSANDKLKKLDETKSEFISVASHQLRTPLTVIKGYISMMLEKNFGELDDRQIEALNKIFQSNEKLVHLVENLLNISRIESGRLRYDFYLMDLRVLAESAVNRMKYIAQSKGLALIFKAAKELPPTMLDEEKIRQVIVNLVDNAIKYSKKGEIETALSKKGNSLLFSVKDNGMGISEEDMADLFNKFSRGEGTFLVHTEGTGLGLYVSKKLIDMHKGEIWAESKGVGKGAIFYFRLPITDKFPLENEAVKIVESKP